MGLQLMLVAILIYWPGLVTDFVPRHDRVDPSKVEIKLDEPAATVHDNPAPNEETPAPGPAITSEDDSAAELQRQFKSGR